MKVIIAIIAFTLLGCNAVKESSNYTITKIEQGKDGQTLYLKDGQNKIFTTVISIPNGNFIKVEEGDKIQIETKEILETEPPIIISKSIKVID